MVITLSKLKVEKAQEKDWIQILEILEEVKLTIWFSGEENYNNFYYVINSETNKMVGCFAIYIEGEVGILKSFATNKNLQGRGIGKYIVNEIIHQILANN